MDSPRLSRDVLGFLLVVPAAWGVLLMFHPNGEGETITYADLQDKLTAWFAVHIGMLVFIPLMAAAVFLLLRGVDGVAAQVSRVALVLFVVFYGAWEAIVGIGTGILVTDINALPEAARMTSAGLVESTTDNVLVRAFGVFGSIGSLAFITAMIATGIALRSHADAPLAVSVLLGLSGFLITAHPPPFGPMGLACFIAAVLLYARSRSRAGAEVPLAAPRPA